MATSTDFIQIGDSRRVQKTSEGKLPIQDNGDLSMDYPELTPPLYTGDSMPADLGLPPWGGTNGLRRRCYILESRFKAQSLIFSKQAV